MQNKQTAAEPCKAAPINQKETVLFVGPKLKSRSSRHASISTVWTTSRTCASRRVATTRISRSSVKEPWKNAGKSTVSRNCRTVSRPRRLKTSWDPLLNHLFAGAPRRSATVPAPTAATFTGRRTRPAHEHAPDRLHGVPLPTRHHELRRIQGLELRWLHGF